MYEDRSSKVKPFIEFNITQKCNYKCEYCIQWRRRTSSPEELHHASDEVIDGFVDLVKEVGSEYDVNLIGGEPFCHPKLTDIAKRLSDLGNKVILVTNMSFPVVSFKKIIDVTNDNLLIYGTVHVAQIKDLEKTLNKIIEINNLLGDNSKTEITTVVEEETFETLIYMENKLKEHNIDFIYIRKIKKDGALSEYSNKVEDYLKKREHQYNRDILNSRKINNKNVLCYAGSKLFHVLTDGTITRCWSYQTKPGFQILGNVKDKNSIKLFKSPLPCYSPICYCRHATERNAYFDSSLTPLYRIANLKVSQEIFSVKNEYSNDQKHKVIELFGIKMRI